MNDTTGDTSTTDSAADALYAWLDTLSNEEVRALTDRVFTLMAAFAPDSVKHAYKKAAEQYTPSLTEEEAMRSLGRVVTFVADQRVVWDEYVAAQKTHVTASTEAINNLTH